MQPFQYKLTIMTNYFHGQLKAPFLTRNSSTLVS